MAEPDKAATPNQPATVTVDGKQYYTSEAAQQIFDRIRNDPNQPKGPTEVSCVPRREMAIINMIDTMGVQPAAIGRITVTAEMGATQTTTRLSVTNPIVYEYEVQRRMKSGMSETKAKEEVAKGNAGKIQWDFHTAPTIEVWDAAAKKPVTLVLDPGMGTQPMTKEEWLGKMQKGEVAVYEMKLGQPNLELNPHLLSDSQIAKAAETLKGMNKLQPGATVREQVTRSLEALTAPERDTFIEENFKRPVKGYSAASGSSDSNPRYMTDNYKKSGLTKDVKVDVDQLTPKERKAWQETYVEALEPAVKLGKIREGMNAKLRAEGFVLSDTPADKALAVPLPTGSSLTGINANELPKLANGTVRVSDPKNPGKITMIVVENPAMVPEVENLLGANKGKVRIITPDQIKTLTFEEKVQVFEGLQREINEDKKKTGAKPGDRNLTEAQLERWQKTIVETFDAVAKAPEFKEHTNRRAAMMVGAVTDTQRTELKAWENGDKRYDSKTAEGRAAREKLVLDIAKAQAEKLGFATPEVIFDKKITKGSGAHSSGPPERIFLSDALVEAPSPREIIRLLSHEMGHSDQHHLQREYMNGRIPADAKENPVARVFKVQGGTATETGLYILSKPSPTPVAQPTPAVVPTPAAQTAPATPPVPTPPAPVAAPKPPLDVTTLPAKELVRMYANSQRASGMLNGASPYHEAYIKSVAAQVEAKIRNAGAPANAKTPEPPIVTVTELERARYKIYAEQPIEISTETDAQKLVQETMGKKPWDERDLRDRRSKARQAYEVFYENLSPETKASFLPPEAFNNPEVIKAITVELKAAEVPKSATPPTAAPARPVAEVSPAEQLRRSYAKMYESLSPEVKTRLPTLEAFDAIKQKPPESLNPTENQLAKNAEGVMKSMADSAARKGMKLDDPAFIAREAQKLNDSVERQQKAPPKLSTRHGNSGETFDKYGVPNNKPGTAEEFAERRAIIYDDAKRAAADKKAQDAANETKRVSETLFEKPTTSVPVETAPELPKPPMTSSTILEPEGGTRAARETAPPTGSQNTTNLGSDLDPNRTQVRIPPAGGTQPNPLSSGSTAADPTRTQTRTGVVDPNKTQVGTGAAGINSAQPTAASPAAPTAVKAILIFGRDDVHTQFLMEMQQAKIGAALAEGIPPEAVQRIAEKAANAAQAAGATEKGYAISDTFMEGTQQYWNDVKDAAAKDAKAKGVPPQVVEKMMADAQRAAALAQYTQVLDPKAGMVAWRESFNEAVKQFETTKAPPAVTVADGGQPPRPGTVNAPTEGGTQTQTNKPAVTLLPEKAGPRVTPKSGAFWVHVAMMAKHAKDGDFKTVDGVVKASTSATSGLLIAHSMLASKETGLMSKSLGRATGSLGAGLMIPLDLVSAYEANERGRTTEANGHLVGAANGGVALYAAATGNPAAAAISGPGAIVAASIITQAQIDEVIENYQRDEAARDTERFRLGPTPAYSAYLAANYASKDTDKFKIDPLTQEPLPKGLIVPLRDLPPPSSKEYRNLSARFLGDKAKLSVAEQRKILEERINKNEAARETLINGDQEKDGKKIIGPDNGILNDPKVVFYARPLFAELRKEDIPELLKTKKGQQELLLRLEDAKLKDERTPDPPGPKVDFVPEGKILPDDYKKEMGGVGKQYERIKAKILKLTDVETELQADRAALKELVGNEKGMIAIERKGGGAPIMMPSLELRMKQYSAILDEFSKRIPLKEKELQAAEASVARYDAFIKLVPHPDPVGIDILEKKIEKLEQYSKTNPNNPIAKYELLEKRQQLAQRRIEVVPIFLKREEKAAIEVEGFNAALGTKEKVRADFQAKIDSYVSQNPGIFGDKDAQKKLIDSLTEARFKTIEEYQKGREPLLKAIEDANKKFPPSPNAPIALQTLTAINALVEYDTQSVRKLYAYDASQELAKAAGAQMKPEQRAEFRRDLVAKLIVLEAKTPQEIATSLNDLAAESTNDAARFIGLKSDLGSDANITIKNLIVKANQAGLDLRLFPKVAAMVPDYKPTDDALTNAVKDKEVIAQIRDNPSAANQLKGAGKPPPRSGLTMKKGGKIKPVEDVASEYAKGYAEKRLSILGSSMFDIDNNDYTFDIAEQTLLVETYRQLQEAAENTADQEQKTRLLAGVEMIKDIAKSSAADMTIEKMRETLAARNQKPAAPVPPTTKDDTPDKVTGIKTSGEPVPFVDPKTKEKLSRQKVKLELTDPKTGKKKEVEIVLSGRIDGDNIAVTSIQFPEKPPIDMGQPITTSLKQVSPEFETQIQKMQTMMGDQKLGALRGLLGGNGMENAEQSSSSLATGPQTGGQRTV